MSMQHDLRRMKAEKQGPAKTFDEVCREAEAYEKDGQLWTAGVMWNVAESVAQSPEQRKMARDRREQNSKKRAQ